LKHNKKLNKQHSKRQAIGNGGLFQHLLLFLQLNLGIDISGLTASIKQALESLKSILDWITSLIS
jgi:hypothetical protein